MGFILFQSLALGLFASRLPRELRVTCPVPPICARCKYDLSASLNAPACPECGLDWHDATTRREASSPLAVDGTRAAQAFLAWAVLLLYAIVSRPIAIALISLNYWMDGYRHINFVNVATGRLSDSIFQLGTTPLTAIMLFCLPILSARYRARLGIRLVLIAFVIDTILWAIPHPLIG